MVVFGLNKMEHGMAKKRASPGSPFRFEDSVRFEISNYPANGCDVENRKAVNHASQEGEMADEVDLSWDAFGKVENVVEGIIGEELRAFITGEGELVLDVGQGSRQIERTEMKASRNALGKGLVDRKA